MTDLDLHRTDFEVERRKAPAAAPPVRPDRLPPFTWSAFLLAGAVAVVGYQVVPAGIGDDAIYAAIGLASVATIFFGATIHRPTLRSPWYLMATGQLLWVIGDIVDSWRTDVDKVVVFPSLADAFYLMAYPVIALGLYQLIRVHRRGRDVAELLDGATVTVGLALLFWVVIAGPTLAEDNQSFAVASVSVSYPLADILMVGLMVALLMTIGGRSTSFRLLIVALFLLVAGDTTSSALGLFTSTDTRAYDWIWLTSYLLWGAAALHPSMRLLTEPDANPAERFGRRRFAAMGLATLIAPGTLATEKLAGLHLTVWPVVIGSVTMFLLVVGRMSMTIHHIVFANEQREALREELVYQAAHDSLTQLPNRAQAMRLLQGALHRAQRSGSIIGVLFIDLDGFKAINDTHGHLAGDELLRMVARTLQDQVRAGDVVARLGGDEFVVVLEPVDVQESAVLVADRLVESLQAPFMLSGGHEVRIGASVGLAISRDGRVEAEQLLQKSDVAVYRAKAAGRGRTEVFDDQLRAELVARTELESALARAIEEDQLVVYYQPVVEVQSGRVDGYEALVRWHHPERGLLQPADFIPVAEMSDLICELDAWVLRRAMRQLAEWNDRPGRRRMNLGVNVSGRHVARRRILQDVRSALDEAGVGPGQLVLEVTETVLMDEPVARAHLEELRRGGLLISIDDFGTGYNSIARLETIPADVVKVDKRFVDVGSTSAKLLPLMIQSAHAFGLPVVAEGVENAEQLDVLRSLGCEMAQGFFLARPMDAVTAAQWQDASDRSQRAMT